VSNEPRICLKSLTSRVELEDYAKAIQMIDTMKDEDGKPVYKDLSMLMREAFHNYVSPIQLDVQHKEWVEVQRQKNLDERAKKREKHRSFFSRMFFK